MFKKLVCAIVAMSVVAPAFAAQDAFITFKNGKTAVYKNLPDSVDNARFEQILRRDHGMGMADIDPASSRIVEVADVIAPQPKTEEFCSSTACKVAVSVLVIGALAYGIKALGPASPHPCVLPTDRARDGSLCGGRASSVRPGGR